MFNFLFSFFGTSGRLAYLFGNLLIAVLFIVLPLLSDGFPLSLLRGFSPWVQLGTVAAWFLLFLWCYLAIGVRRLHDLGLSGGFYLLHFFLFVTSAILMSLGASLWLTAHNMAAAEPLNTITRYITAPWLGVIEIAFFPAIGVYLLSSLFFIVFLFYPPYFSAGLGARPKEEEREDTHSIFSFFFNVSGTAGRLAYIVGNLLLGAVFIGIPLSLEGFPFSLFDGFPASIRWMLIMAWCLLFLWCTGTIGVRRLHDMGCGGWRYIVTFLLFWVSFLLLAVNEGAHNTAYAGTTLHTFITAYAPAGWLESTPAWMIPASILNLLAAVFFIVFMFYPPRLGRSERRAK